MLSFLLNCLSAFVLGMALLERPTGQLAERTGKLVLTDGGATCCCSTNNCSCCLPEPGHKLKSVTISVTINNPAAEPCEPFCSLVATTFLLTYVEDWPYTPTGCCCVAFVQEPFSLCDYEPPIEDFPVSVFMSAIIGCRIVDIDTMERFIQIQIGASGGDANSVFEHVWPPSGDVPFDCKNLDWTGIAAWQYDNVAGGLQLCHDGPTATDVTIEVIDVQWE
jgi:hypothetical protein